MDCTKDTPSPTALINKLMFWFVSFLSLSSIDTSVTCLALIRNACSGCGWRQWSCCWNWRLFLHWIRRNCRTIHGQGHLAVDLVSPRAIEGLKRTHALVDKSKLMPVLWSVNWSGWTPNMGLRVPFVSNPFGALSPNKVVKTIKQEISFILAVLMGNWRIDYWNFCFAAMITWKRVFPEINSMQVDHAFSSLFASDWPSYSVS